MMGPKPFLHRLGIRRVENGPKVECPKAPLEGDVDVMAIELMDALFASEATALITIGSNFDRLANSMDRLAKSPAFAKGKLGRVAEVGGGTGLLGLWLTNNQLCESCEVFDRAKNPLALGAKWA